MAAADQQRLAHRQQLLQQLGLTAWRGRQQSGHALPVATIWRQTGQPDIAQPVATLPDDCANQPSVTSDNPAGQPVPLAAALTVDQINDQLLAARDRVDDQNTLAHLAVVKNLLEQGKPAPAVNPSPKPAPTKPATRPDVRLEQAIREDESFSLTTVPPVSLSMLSLLLPGWALVIPLSELDQPQHRLLWQNLKMGLRAQDGPGLNWPLYTRTGRLRSTRETALKKSLQGYLFGFSHEGRQAGLMGSLPDHLIGDGWQRLPYLSELLAEPQRKASLYRLLSR